jgi:hypothetical protein
MLSWLAIFSNANVFLFGPPKGIVFIRITYTTGSYRTYESNLSILVESKNQAALQKRGSRSEDAESQVMTTNVRYGLSVILFNSSPERTM